MWSVSNGYGSKVYEDQYRDHLLISHATYVNEYIYNFIIDINQ